jgi:plasmid maintenance system antidote protein VapI
MCWVPLGLNVTQAAKVPGVTRQARSNILNGRTSLTAGVALPAGKPSARRWNI